tara:strand:- start:55 stop:747 length:693 start_codon:yes stop_codon:yes gene_type:complete
MKEGYGAAAKVALKAAKPVAKKVGKFLKNNAGNITNAGLTGLTVASFLPRPQPKDTKEEKEQVNEFLGTAVGGTVGTALGGPVGGLVGGTLGAVTGEIAKKTMNKMKKPIVSKNIGQNKKLSSISAGVDLFDVVKGRLLDEGLSEEEIREIMLSLTPEEIMNEMAVNPKIAAMDAKNKANMVKRAKAKEVPQDVRDAAKRQYKAGTPREDPNNPYTTADKKKIINQYKDN